MLVVTAADHRMHDWMDRCKRAAEGLGYKVLAVDLDQLTEQDFGLERDADGFLPCYFKIPVIKLALVQDSEVLYLDADCIMQDRVDEIWKWEFDVAVAERVEPVVHHKAGLVNTGVVAVRRTVTATKALDAWRQWTERLESEQQALNILALGRGYRWTVHLLPSEIYNNYYFDGSEEQAKIVHYKGDVRHKWKD
jgi:lipopolysaccharide biosynthesis glycosyltransferase